MLRTCLLAATFGAVGIVALAGGAVLRVCVACRLFSPARADAWGVRLWLPVAWCVRRVARLSVHGEPLPDGALIVSNHRSWLDPMIFPRLLPCTFVAKTSIAVNPVVNLLMRVLPIVMIDKSKRSHVPQMVADVRAYLVSGVAVVAFPEGTTSVRGCIREFAPASFQSALDGGRPIAVVALEYRSPANPDEDVSWRDESMWTNSCRIARQRDGIECHVRLLEVLAPPFALTRCELAVRSCARVAEALSCEICGPPDDTAGFGFRRPGPTPR